MNITADNGDTFVLSGATITSGISTPTPVVRANEIAGQPNDLCTDSSEGGVNFLPGQLAGKIVICRRQTGSRVLKSYNASIGGATGMILYNGLPNLGLNTDNHWIPSFHVEKTNPAADPHPLIAFLDSHTGETATFTTGNKTTVPGDVMTSFSSRGPLGDFIKPDVTTVGIQVLAGHTPDPHDTNFVVGPPGQMFQAIAGTSMSSPHSAGVAALVKDAHPSWTPGQIKSALMTSSVQNVLKEDGATPATPFDRGAGSIRADKALNPSVTFDVPSADYFASASNPLGRIHLNLPSINAPTMSGTVETTRTLRNVSGRELGFRVETQAPAGSTIDVRPSRFELGKNKARTLRITISGPKLAMGQYFGQIKLVPTGGGFFRNDDDDDDDDGGNGRHARANQVVLPVAFFKRQGVVTLQHTCAPTTIVRGSSSSCTVRAQNLSENAANAQIEVRTSSSHLRLHDVSAPAAQVGNRAVWSGSLSAAIPPTIESITPGGAPFGYFPLASIGVPAQPGFGDETIANFNIGGAPFRYGSESYSRVGVTSNGYVVVGGGAADDLDFVPQTFPNAARPNNVLAPFWTDLNPGAGGAIRVAVLSDSESPPPNRWLVIEWTAVPVFSSGAPATFQMWLAAHTSGIEHNTFAFGDMPAAGDPAGTNVGAENRSGTSGKNVAGVPADGSSLQVNTGPPTPGGAVSFTYMAQGRRPGVFDSIANLFSDVTTGVTQEVQTITVN
jgi:hypothetical protein